MLRFILTHKLGKGHLNNVSKYHPLFKLFLHIIFFYIKQCVKKAFLTKMTMCYKYNALSAPQH